MPLAYCVDFSIKFVDHRLCITHEKGLMGGHDIMGFKHNIILCAAIHCILIKFAIHAYARWALLRFQQNANAGVSGGHNHYVALITLKD